MHARSRMLKSLRRDLKKERDSIVYMQIQCFSSGWPKAVLILRRDILLSLYYLLEHPSSFLVKASKEEHVVSLQVSSREGIGRNSYWSPHIMSGKGRHDQRRGSKTQELIYQRKAIFDPSRQRDLGDLLLHESWMEEKRTLGIAECQTDFEGPANVQIAYHISWKVSRIWRGGRQNLFLITMEHHVSAEAFSMYAIQLHTDRSKPKLTYPSPCLRGNCIIVIKIVGLGLDLYITLLIN